MTFWEKVRAFANRRVRASYVSLYHLDKRCSVCDTWESEVRGSLKLRSDDPTFNIYETQCWRCGQWTRWDISNGFISVLADTQPPLVRIK